MSDKETFEEYKVGLKQLEKSGISDAYEYVLRKLCSDGFPTNNYFDLCAYYLLEFETIIKERNVKDTPLKDLVEESLRKEKKDKAAKGDKNSGSYIKDTNNNGKSYNKLDKNFVNDPLDKNLKNTDSKAIIQREKIKLKSKELAVTNFNIEIDHQKFFGNKKQNEILPERIELNSLKFVDGRTEKTTMKLKGGENEAEAEQVDFIEKDKALKNLESTNPDPVSFVQLPMESFEIEVDMVNHLTESGTLNKFEVKVHDKPPNLRNTDIKIDAPIKPKEEIIEINKEVDNKGDSNTNAKKVDDALQKKDSNGDKLERNLDKDDNKSNDKLIGTDPKSPKKEKANKSLFVDNKNNSDSPTEEKIKENADKSEDNIQLNETKPQKYQTKKADKSQNKSVDQDDNIKSVNK